MIKSKSCHYTLETTAKMLRIGFFKEDIEIAMNEFSPWDENDIVIHLGKKGTKN